MGVTTVRNLGLLGLLCCSTLAAPALSHSRGLYKTQAEALQRAKELGCEGTHRNNGLWMPCNNEAHLHSELRQE